MIVPEQKEVELLAERLNSSHEVSSGAHADIIINRSDSYGKDSERNHKSIFRRRRLQEPVDDRYFESAKFRATTTAECTCLECDQWFRLREQ